MMRTASGWICQRPEGLNLLVGVLLGGDWRVSLMGRLNSLRWWVASSEKNAAKAFRTDIYGSALLHEAWGSGEGERGRERHPHSNFLVFLWLILSSQHGESLLTNALEENTV